MEECVEFQHICYSKFMATSLVVQFNKVEAAARIDSTLNCYSFS